MLFIVVVVVVVDVVFVVVFYAPAVWLVGFYLVNYCCVRWCSLMFSYLCRLPSVRRSGAVLKIQVWDWDRSSSDDALGHFEVSIGEELLSQQVG